jgi:hypothetical protein
MKISEMLENLKKPIPTAYISTKTIKGKAIRYVSVWDYYELLDQRCGAGNWSIDLEIKEVGRLTVAIAKLTLIGEDRSLSQMAAGNEDSDLDSYGDSTSNSTAQAVRRACAMFGLSRELWLKDKDNSSSLPNVPHKGQITREQWLARRQAVAVGSEAEHWS